MVNFIDERGLLPDIKRSLKVRGNLALRGDTGVGKTTLVHALAEQVKAKPEHFFEMVLTGDTTRWDLLAATSLVKGETHVHAGLITFWLRDIAPNVPKILYLDGFNYGQANVVSLVESLADFRGTIWVPELQETLTRTPLHWIIISYNPAEKAEYTQTQSINIATLRRFHVYDIDYLSPRSEMTLLNEYTRDRVYIRKLVQFANRTRQLYRDGQIHCPVSTGNLIDFCMLKELDVAEERIIELAAGLQLIDQKDTITKLWGEGFHPGED